MGAVHFVGVEQAVAEFAAGRMLIAVYDDSREGDGALVMAAEHVTPEAVTFMVRRGGGPICVPCTGGRLDALNLPLMVPHSEENGGRAFTVSVDHRSRTTGISAFERAAAVRVFVDPAAVPGDLVRPGHVFPLRAKDGGVLRRLGRTEAVVDLARLAELQRVGVICGIMASDGSMMRLPELARFAAEHGLSILSIADLVAFRRRTEKLVQRVEEGTVQTRHGEWHVIAFADLTREDELHVALTMGAVDDGRPVLVRMHSECVTGEVFGSLRCDCGAQLDQAMGRIAAEGRGVIVYLRQEGRGIGLGNKVRAYALQDQGLDTVEANLALGVPVDARDYGIGSQILADLGVRQLRLLTNNPQKYDALSGFGLDIVERVPIHVEPNPYSARYLAVKKTKLGHLLD